MANQNNNRGGSISRDINSLVQEEKQARQQLQNLTELKIRNCDHKSGQARIIPVHDAKNLPNQTKDRYSDTTAYCLRCGAIFEGECYTPDATNGGVYMFNSMLHQIKLNARLDEDDKDMMDQAFAALDTLVQVSTYYNNMVEKLKSGGNKKGGKRNTKGHLGVSADMFNGGRHY